MTLNKNIKIRLISYFFVNTTSFSILPFMTLYFTSNISNLYAGILLILITFFSIIARIIGGYYADLVSRKKIILLSFISSMFFIIFMILFFSLHKLPFIIFTCSYFLFAIFSNISNPAIKAVILDSTDSQNRKKVYIYENWISNMSITLGSFMGGICYSNNKLILFYLLFFSYLISTILYSFINDTFIRTSINNKHLLRNIFRNYKRPLSDTAWIISCIGLILIMSGESSIYNYVAIHLEKTFEPIVISSFTITGVNVMSFIVIENAIIVILLSIFINNKIAKTKEKIIFAIFAIVYAAGYSFMSHTSSLVTLIIIGAIATISEIVIYPIINYRQSFIIPDNNRTGYLTISSLSKNFSDIVAKLIIILSSFCNNFLISILTFIIILFGITFIFISIFGKNEYTFQ